MTFWQNIPTINAKKIFMTGPEKIKKIFFRSGHEYVLKKKSGDILPESENKLIVLF